MREDLFTVVHELFMTDTARYADIVLPATSQLEQADMHEAYGHRFLQYNEPAIAPLGESKSNWDVMRLLAAAMGYHEPWLRQSAEEAMEELLDASRPISPVLEGITFERLRKEGTVPLYFPPGRDVPFSDGRFPTASGKLELRSEAFADAGLDPLPEYTPPPEFAGRPEGDARLTLITGAAHHFVSSSFANMPRLVGKEREVPWIEINPEDARRARHRGRRDGDRLERARRVPAAGGGHGQRRAWRGDVAEGPLAVVQPGRPQRQLDDL